MFSSSSAREKVVLYQGSEVLCIRHLKDLIETSKVGDCRYDELMHTFAADGEYPKCVTQAEWEKVRQACKDLGSAINSIHAKCRDAANPHYPLDKRWTDWILQIVHKACQLQHSEVVQRIVLERGENWPGGGNWSVQFDAIARLFAAAVPLFVNIREAMDIGDRPSILFSGVVEVTSLDLGPTQELESDNDKAMTSTSASPETHTSTADVNPCRDVQLESSEFGC